MRNTRIKTIMPHYEMTTDKKVDILIQMVKDLDKKIDSLKVKEKIESIL